jgi:hypothetical protein
VQRGGVKAGAAAGFDRRPVGSPEAAPVFCFCPENCPKSIKNREFLMVFLQVEGLLPPQPSLPDCGIQHELEPVRPYMEPLTGKNGICAAFVVF